MGWLLREVHAAVSSRNCAHRVGWCRRNQGQRCCEKFPAVSISAKIDLKELIVREDHASADDALMDINNIRSVDVRLADPLIG
jgi:hypothetical protein